ncbi:MAG: ATP-binding protein [Chloroflexota bacterium]
MTGKLLPSLEIHGFRVFDHLIINNLGRVNLIVGKNNVGKSSLLEAIWIYANQASPSVLRTLLEGRDEMGQEETQPTGEDVENQITSIRHLFYGRGTLKNIQKPITIGPVGETSKTVRINFKWFTEIVERGQGIRRLHEIEDFDSVNNPLPGLSIQFGDELNILKTLLSESISLRKYREQIESPLDKKCVFVPANGLTSSNIERFWDGIALTPLEDDVLHSLQLIEPTVERINLVGSNRTSRLRNRIPIVKIEGLDDPIPLRSLGEGMNRILGIALALANAKGSLLLIDEIESGLHYSIQPNIWQFVFQVAKRLNIQVFATTHSWDCVEAFQKSSRESDQDGYLIRLENKQGKIIPTLFNEKELSNATREQIEVR